MKRNGTGILIVLVAVAMVFGILAVVQADPGNGKGKGSIGKNCKKCPTEPQDCTFFECDNHFCNYTCVDPDGTIRSLTLPK